MRSTGRVRIAKRVRAFGTLAIVVSYIATLVVASVVPSDAQVMPNAHLGFVALAFVSLTLLVIMLARVVGRVFPTELHAPRSTQRRFRPWAVDASLGVVVCLGVLWMIAVIDSGGFDQRCVDSQTMTVVSPSYCQGSASPGGSTNPQAWWVYEWYYGGSGTQVGDEVQGGSVTEPGTDEGSGSGSSGGSAGDDGGDGGGE